MRAILPVLLAAALLLAPVAMADGSTDHRRDGEAKAKAAQMRATHTDDDHDDNKSARAESRAAFRENRTALFDRVIAQLQTLRESWHDNATKIREDCRAADYDHANASKENRTAHAHCIRDGYKSWRTAHAADIKELREELRILLDSRRGGGHGSD